VECNECSEKLDLEPVADPQIDFMRVVCGECGNKNRISLTRELELEKSQKGGRE